MTSLPLRIDHVHFEETLRQLDLIHSSSSSSLSTALSIELAIDIARLHSGSDNEFPFCSHFFPHSIHLDEEDTITFPQSEYDHSRLVLIVTHIDPGVTDCYVNYYPEDDYWLLSMMFDTFPLHSVALQPGMIVSNFASTRCKLFAHGRGTIRVLSFLF